MSCQVSKIPLPAHSAVLQKERARKWCWSRHDADDLSRGWRVSDLHGIWQNFQREVQRALPVKIKRTSDSSKARSCRLARVHCVRSWENIVHSMWKPIFSCVSSRACVCRFSHGKEAKNYVSVEIMLNFPLWILRGGTSIRNSGRSYTLNLYDHHW